MLERVAGALESKQIEQTHGHLNKAGESHKNSQLQDTRNG